jgi:hypothetical protein
VQRGAIEHRPAAASAQRPRVIGLDADERLVPAEHLHGRPGCARRVAITSSDAAVYASWSTGRMTHRVPCARRRAAASRADAELARLVGGGRDDGAFGRVAPPADDHRLAGELGMPQHLDRCDELVEIDVQHP